MMSDSPIEPGTLMPDTDLPAPGRARRRRRAGSRAGAGRRFWLALAAVGALLVAGAYWAGTQAASPAAIEKQYAPAPRTVLTATVVMRRLSQTLTVQGVIAAASVYRVPFGPVNVPGAQPIVTAKPTPVGSVVADGSLLAQVAGRPVFAMRGVTPMYRDLTIGDQGPDVAQLQDGLAALGFQTGDSPGEFGRSTIAAVRAFYRSMGYAPPEGPTAKAGTLILPQAEIVFIPRLPAVVGSSSLALGQPVPNPALTLASGQLEAVVPLSAAQASLVGPGRPAVLYISGYGGAVRRVAATVTAVRAVGRASGISGSSGPEAVLAPHTSLRWSAVGHNVAASIVIAATKGPVLAVPVAALYTTADGQAMVTVIARGTQIRVPVHVGAETGGYVPVEPLRGRLAAGDLVLVGE